MSAREFQPSTKSFTPSSQAAARLRYLRRAAEVVEAHVNEEGEVPSWVLDRINQAAQLMGMAVSYVSFADEKKKLKFKTSESETSPAEAAVKKSTAKPTKKGKKA